MDLLKDDIKKLYLNFLVTSFISAMIVSIYGIVDMAMVGHYHGPVGTAALSVVAPVWNVIYSLGLLTGIGGSILYSVCLGSSGDAKKANEYFTAGILLTAVLAILCTAALWLWEDPILILFGADESLLELAKRYMLPVRYAVPSFMLSQILAAFLRNDSAPGLATGAVIFGGVFNIAGDYFFVFTLDMGILGAGIATCMGSVFGVLMMLSHFFSKKNTLQLVRPQRLWEKWKQICSSGFSAFFVDLAMGLLTILFNHQILHYLGTDALAVYGVIVNISTFVQCCAYGVGQAAQPILSQNYGAGQKDRIQQLVGYNLITIGILSVIWVLVCMLFPNGFIRLFMTSTDAVLKIAPFIFRAYATSFPFLLLNIYSTYYFQSVLQPGTSFIVSVSRGLVISGLLICLMPLVFSADSMWFAMTIAEFITAVFVVIKMRQYLK